MQQHRSHSLYSLRSGEAVKPCLPVNMRSQDRLSQQMLSSRIVVTLPGVSRECSPQLSVKEVVEKSTKSVRLQQRKPTLFAPVSLASKISMPSLQPLRRHFNNHFQPLPPIKDNRYAAYELKSVGGLLAKKNSKLDFW